MAVVKEPMLPNAVEAEEALLGSILIHPAALQDARQLEPDDFYRNAHRLIFASMRELEREGSALDLVTLAARLERYGHLELIGGHSALNDLINAVPTAVHAPYYADLVKKAADGRKVIQVGSDLVKVGFHSTDPAQAAAQLVSEQLARPEPEPETLTPEQAREKLKEQAPRWLSLPDLMAQEYPPTLWVVPDLLPEGLTLLAAKPKLGKSWMALGLALAVAAGGLALGQRRVEPGAVLYLALEDSPKRLKYRTTQLLAGQPIPERLTFATDCPRLDNGGLAIIELWLQATPDARLVILDTLVKLRGQSRSGTLYAEDYAALEKVQRLAHRYGVAILVIHHTGKESRDDALDEVNATQGLNGAADNILILRRERGKAEATLLGDGRELNGIELSLQFDPETGAWREVPPRERLLAKTLERDRIVRLLREAGRPMGPTEIAAALGKNLNTVKTLLIKMARDGEIVAVGDGTYCVVGVAVTPINFINSINSREEEGEERGEEDEPSPSLPHPPDPHQLTKLTKLTVVPAPPANTSSPSPADRWDAGATSPIRIKLISKRAIF